MAGRAEETVCFDGDGGVEGRTHCGGCYREIIGA